jgi:hypothetical protein
VWIKFAYFPLKWSERKPWKACGMLVAIKSRNLTYRDCHFQIAYDKANPRGRDAGVTATAEHEAWILTKWNNRVLPAVMHESIGGFLSTITRSRNGWGNAPPPTADQVWVAQTPCLPGRRGQPEGIDSA